MALTSEFECSVRDKNLLRIRIMLKDSLLVDKSFRQFSEMCRYAETHGAFFWMEKTEELVRVSRDAWNMDLMNLELTRLVNDFTKERLLYCQSIIQKVYEVSMEPVQSYNFKKMTPQSDSHLMGNPRPLQDSNSNYDVIIKSVRKMKQIIMKNKTENVRSWPHDDIETIQLLAKHINQACENIKKRRG